MGHFTVAVGAGLLCIELLVKYPGFSMLLFYILLQSKPKQRCC